MKKKLFSTGLIAALCLSSAFTMTGCGEKEPYSDYDLSEYVTVGEYKGLEYDKISVSVTDEEVEEEIQNRLESHATTEDSETGTVEDGDTVTIAYEGKVDGETFEGGSSDSYDLTIGSGSFIDGFEDGLIGKEVGSVVTLNLTFPEDYEQNTDLQGKDVVFEVNIKSKKVEVVPEYNMDFVSEYYSDYDSLEAFEESVRQDLLDSKTQEAEAQVKDTLWQTIVAASEVKKYPEEEKNAIIESQSSSMKQTAEDYGMEWEDYLDAIGYTEEELNSAIEEYAENTVFQEMLLYSIADAEGIEVTDDEYQEYLQELLTNAGMDEDSFESTYNMTIEEWAEENNLRPSILLDKVMDKVMEYGTEVSGDEE